MTRLIGVLFSCLALSACSSGVHSSDQQKVTTFYDYQLYTPANQPISVSSLPTVLTDADVILIGEWHTHSAIHRFQTDIVKQLVLDNPQLALSMEQFSRDKQSVIDAYLNGEVGEQTLIKTGNGWPNYESDYRPLIELAKANSMQVLAANAPKPIVRCIGRQGIAYLDKLDADDRAYLARNVETGPSRYKDKFMASMHHGKPEQTERQFAAQVTWDETMAESITDYIRHHPDHQVVHIAGKFHTEQGLGIKTSILRRMPELNVVVITPTSEPASVNADNEDFLLQVLAPPVRYVKQENRIAAYHHLTKRNDNLSCK
ncbi:ChaN family lipoprotein [Vibrio brasiliensis]|uniref:ChaN family lipoprotein n=1 Tax=Vibrio brasiliensis TaxID=170652 RepID=UPI001EFE6D27|nr:ChaN family lipoprotein [Vibrio brasiliensis]MCG9648874.1 ChaN family lipoprotein [Vibrio brasiliensis]